jgi:RHS repeat-associated protein
MVADRLGSVWDRGGVEMRYYPYGEERTTTAQNEYKFGTYYRDETTNVDYAMQRNFSSQVGRFLTPDPYRASGGPAAPQSWNRYSYVEGDPVNFNDPEGLMISVADMAEAIVRIRVIPLGWGKALDFFGPYRGGGAFWYWGVGKPGNDRLEPDVPTNDWAHDRLSKRLGALESSHCGEVFQEAGIRLTDLRAAARKTRFYNPANPKYTGATVSELVGGGDNSIAGSPSAFGQTAAFFTGPRGNAVMLYADFWGPVGPQDEYFYNVQGSQLLHELIHGLSGFRTDLEVATNPVFQRHGLRNWFAEEVGGSHHFTLWLASDCNPVPLDWH